MKTKRITIIFIILVLISVNLCSCIDPYAADRYPTAKEAVEASGEYTISKIYGEKELNGMVCFLADAGTTVSSTMIKNENGYCEIDKNERYDSKISMYAKGNVAFILYHIKFSKHIIEIRMQKYENEPIVTDTIQSNSVVIPENKTWYIVYLVLDRIPNNYKICVDGIWYPLPQTLLENFFDIPPQ